MERGRETVSGTGKRIRAQIPVLPHPSHLSAGWDLCTGLLGLSETMAGNSMGLGA